MRQTTREEETRRILLLTGGDFMRAFELVERQLAVLVLRTQVLLSLAGIVITVTGFSGRTIAQTSVLARTMIAGGIAIVLVSAAVAIVGVLRLRWMTEVIGNSPEETIAKMLGHRDRKSRFLAVAMVLFVAGFTLYVVAIALMLLSTPPLLPG